MADTIKSPCTLVCSIDMKSGHCFGCGRTREEIGSWMGMTDLERRDLMEILPSRMANIERKPRRETRRQRLKRQKAASA
ncbi:MAG: DUF1289 domain-containing protein [Pseudomonadota bacterium]